MPHHLALGTYVVIEGETDYARRCFKEYAMLPDRSGRYAALYRPIHMIGLELGISVASAALRHEPTGAPSGFRSDVAATAKRNLKQGEVLDGEGGFCVWGKQTPADVSLDQGYFPLGLAQNVKLKRDIAEGERMKWSDVEYDPNEPPSASAARWRPRSAGATLRTLLIKRGGRPKRYARLFDHCPGKSGSCRSNKASSFSSLMSVLMSS